jgi:hypothetical protein
MTELDAKKEMAEVFAGLCLQKLVELGKVERERVLGTWYIEFDETKLKGKGLAGAATLDAFDRPVIYLLPELSIDGLMWVVAHEAIHLMQICKGDLIPCYGYKIWKGQRYQSLSNEHPDYFEAQPWEKEANELHSILLEHLKSKMPTADS